MKLVVTGNIGCGKSTVVKLLLKGLTDYTLFDFDQMVSELYLDPDVQIKLTEAFGTCIKSEISNVVFKNEWQLKRLRELMDDEILRKTKAAFMQPNIILDIPLYFEYIDSALNLFADLVLCVASDPEFQIERVKARSGWSEEKIRAVMERQITQRTKTQLSNYTIWNLGTLEELQVAVDDTIKFVNSYSPY